MKCISKRNHNLKVEIVSINGSLARVKPVEGAIASGSPTNPNLITLGDIDLKWLSPQPWPLLEQDRIENVIPLFGGY